MLDEKGAIVAGSSSEQMTRVLKAQMDRLPFLVCGDKDELEQKGVQVVAV